MKNYYKILGVERTSTQEEIKKGYLAKIKKYHPDVYKGNSDYAQNQTALLNEAYQTLKDETLRKDYDYKLSKQSKSLSEKVKDWAIKTNPLKEIKHKEDKNVENEANINTKPTNEPKKKRKSNQLSKEEQQERTILDLGILALSIMLITLLILTIAL